MEIKYPGVPLILGGDLNGIIFKNETEPELSLFQKNSYLDALELLNRPVEERVSYFYFDKNQNRNDMQLDYMLLNKRFKNIVKPNSRILGFDPQYSPFPPEKLAEKQKMPSDHLPYYLEIEL